MDFKQLQQNYEKYNEIVVGGNHKESYYTDGTLLDKITEADQYQLLNSSFYISYRNPLNTTVLADAMVSRFDNGDTNFFPELALMLLKTYSKKLLENNSYALDPKNLITVFNKNQELVEIPYSVLLLLGGLYYFQENEILIGDLSTNKLYDRINGVKTPFNVTNINRDKDVYDNSGLYRKPGQYLRLVKGEQSLTETGESQVINFDSEIIKFPSVRLLNRSLYNVGTSNFQIKTGINNNVDVVTNEKINTRSTMPSVGYGIQNKFLNYYNKVLFGEYLNGTTTKQNENLPHVIAGGYTGMLKPIKTYTSDEIEFTAFYRNLSLRDYTVDVNSLISELDVATKPLNELPTSVNEVNSVKYLTKIKSAFAKSFIVYSKIKAAYLSDDFGTERKSRLREVITALSSVNNIKNNVNVDLCDIYYLVSHVFFTSFHRVSETLDQLQSFDIRYRLFLNLPVNDYQKSALGDDLNDILNKNFSTNDEQIESLTNFLDKIWSIEKLYLNDKYRSISKTTFAMYPSAGGYINPNTLINPIKLPTDTLKIHMGSSMGLDVKAKVGFNNLYQESGQPTYIQDNPLGSDLTDPGYNMVDPNSFESSDELYRLLKNSFITRKEQTEKLDNPTYEKYIVDSSFNRSIFFNNYCFNNHSILNNTTRLFWFEGNSIGYHMMLDIDSNSNSVFFEKENGLKSAFNANDDDKNLNYLTDIKLFLTDHLNFTDYKDISYSSNYDFSRLLDSINIEKLIEFSEEFKKFATFTTNTIPGAFNINSILKASTILTYDDLISVIDGFSDNKIVADGGLILTKDEVVLILIGNSMYNYEFLDKCGLSKIMNIALTTGQKTRCENVASEFCSYITTFANKSTIDSVTKLGDFQLSIHNYHSSPEVLFTNSRTYDDLREKLQGNITDTDFNKLITRRILFGNQYIQPYTNLSANEENELTDLNRSYLYSKIHHQTNTNLNLIYSEYYVNVVKSFFKYLNIRYTKDNYKQLLKLIRGYVYHVSSSNKNINSSFLPNFGIIPEQVYLDFLNKIKITQSATDFSNIAASDNTRSVLLVNPNAVINNSGQPTPNFEQYSLEQSKIDNLADSYFLNFNKNTFESITNGLNGFISGLNENAKRRLNEINEGNATQQSEKESTIAELKKSTYYNIKSLYDKIATNGLDESLPEINASIPSKFDDIKSLDIDGAVKDSKLFYNYRINPNYCYIGGQYTVSDSYDLYKIFQIVDRGNNDIGSKTLADLSYLYDNLYTEFAANSNENPSNIFTIRNLTERSVQTLFSGLASSNGFLLQQIPNYVNLNGYLSRVNSGNNKNAGEAIYELVDELFGVHTDTSMLGENTDTAFGGLTGFPGYIFQLGNISSELSTNDRTTRNKKNDNLNSFCLDVGYDNNREVSVIADTAPDDILKSNVTCFTVDFATQNQQMFNSVQLDTSEFYETEESIRVWVDTINKTQPNTQTTNIFPILEKRSYSCTVTGLGNATIQPLSYFYLRNVPLFYGTYWVTNVAHEIKPNTMLTTFKGLRQPIAGKNDIRKQLLYLLRERAKQLAEANQLANVIVTEGIPDTSGEIFSIPLGTQNANDTDPYGYVYQKTASNTYYKFSGIDVISSFIYSITNTDKKTATSVGLIHVLYNQSRAFIGTDSHSDVIRNMKNIAIGVMREGSKSGDIRYANTASDNPSLSKILKDNKFSTTSWLYNLLSDITKSLDSYSNKDDLRTLDKNDKIYSIKLLIQNDFRRELDSQSVTFLMDTQINNKPANNIPINQATHFIEAVNTRTKLNTTIDGFGATTEDPASYLDIFSLFSSKLSNTDREIRVLDEKIDVSRTKGNDIVSTTSVKFLGSYSPGNVSFFTAKSNNSELYGSIPWSNLIKNKYKLGNATPEQISNEFVPNAGNTQEKDTFIRALVEGAKLELDTWNGLAVGVDEKDYGSNTIVTNALDKYWEAATGKKYSGDQWSAAFISYIVKNANPKPNDFKYAAKHSIYIVDARDNNRSWKAYSTSDPNIKLRIGDLICNARDNTSGNNIKLPLNDFKVDQNGHCDCVVEINEGKFAKVIGGNLSDKVISQNVNLNPNGTVNDPHRSVILRFEPTVTTTNNESSDNTSNRGTTEVGRQEGSIQTNLAETEAFLIEVLNGIGITTPNAYQVEFMKDWRQMEGGKAAWNPLNTTLKKPNATINNSHEVKNYPDRQTGVEATIDTLNSNRYIKVVEAIKNIKKESDIDLVMIAVNNSRWGTKFSPVSNKSYGLREKNYIWKPPIIDK